jgi:hypothetical protein
MTHCQPTNRRILSGASARADKTKSTKIAPVFPKNADPLFCTFDKPIASHINKVGGICFHFWSTKIDAYNLSFCLNKEVWVLHLDDNAPPILTRLAYALLRHQAKKIQIQCFPIWEAHHDK